MTVATGIGTTVIADVVATGADSLLAVTVAVPGATAVTVALLPAAVTVRTVGLLDDQVTTLPETTLPAASRVTAVSC